MNRILCTAILAFTAVHATNAETITVCASGCDYTSINAAIDASSNGDIIQLSAETYTEGQVVDTDGKAVTIRGTTDKEGNPTATIDGADSHRILRISSGEGLSTTVENLNIVRGRNSGVGAEGGGMLISSASRPTIRNCVFENNVSTGYGGGLDIVDSSDPLISNCRFTNNLSVLNGGGLGVYRSSPTIDACVFFQNRTIEGPGGGLSNYAGAPTISSCTFQSNAAETLNGGGAYNGNGSAVFQDCLFVQNTALEQGGGAYNFGTASNIANAEYVRCVFRDNVAASGPPGNGMTNIGFTTPRLEGCEIRCNGPEPIAGGYVDAGENCIRDDCLECVGDTDSDGDGVPDDIDGCPADPAKTEPGRCGCGVVDTDLRGDFNCDGVYDQSDYVAMQTDLGICPGDLDGNGRVDGADLGLLFIAWGNCP